MNDLLETNAGPSDRDLVDETLAGRLQAYDELMRRYDRFIYKLAYGYAHSHEGALDLSQTVFLRVYRGLRAFRRKSTFRTWLVRIACNEGVSWVRANRRHLEGREPLSEIEARESSPGSQVDHLVALERRNQLLAGLELLNPQHRKAIVLRYFHELSVKELASILECSEGTAKSMLFRGVKRLREQVAGG